MPSFSFLQYVGDENSKFCSVLTQSMFHSRKLSLNILQNASFLLENCENRQGLGLHPNPSPTLPPDPHINNNLILKISGPCISLFDCWR